MTPILELLSKFKDIGVKISLDSKGENLSIKGNLGSLTDADKIELKANKESILEFLRDQQQKVVFIPKAPIGQESYSVSDAQRRIWTLGQFEEGSIAYNMPFSLVIEDSLEIEVFQRAVISVVERHEILRTVFKENEEGEPRQWILDAIELDFKVDYLDFRHAENKEEKLETFISKDNLKSFDLENGPLLRITIIQLLDKKYIIYYNLHHIAGDGWSMNIITNEVMSFYKVYTENRASELEPLRIQYKDYSVWQLSQLEVAYKEHRSYWLSKLSGELSLLNLPSSKLRPKVKSYSGRSLSAYLSKDLTSQLEEFSIQQNGSLFMSLLAGWNVIFHRYTGNQDVIIGSPVAGRHQVELENQVGCYIGTLALRNKISSDQNFLEFYKELKENTLASFHHQEYPFDRLVEELELSRDISRNAIFDALLTLQNKDENIEQYIPSDDEIEKITDRGVVASKFDLEISFKVLEGLISFSINFNSDVYDYEMIERLMVHYKNVMNQLTLTPEKPIGVVSYLTHEEEQQLIFGFNDTKQEYPKEATLLDLFEKQVEQSLESIAVVFNDKELTYNQLNEASNQFGHYLRETYSINPNDLVGIKVERSAQMIVAMLGVLKSGGAYVPIDLDYPQDRIDYILNDSNCKVLIDEDELEKFQKDQHKYSTANLQKTSSRNDLAYIIYTSGSTGNPKGVMIEHRNVSAFLYWCKDEFSASNYESVFGVTSICFDLSVFEIFFTLISGKQLVFLKNALSIPSQLESTKNVMINTVPSVVKVLLNDKVDLSNVNVLNMAGEPIPTWITEELKSTTIELRNLYGPSEDTTYSTICTISKTDKVTIGRPISNTRVYILDAFENLTSIGVAGEICLSGDGVARGYLNKPGITLEKFSANPFEKETIMYKTGDLGRWLEDGNIEFLGRGDDQAKIRGFRIELGEIQGALENIETITAAVVIAVDNDDSEKEIVAYLTSNKEQNSKDIRSALKKSLPDYMIPSYFIQLDVFPLTPNGKIDKKVLPSPEGINTGIEYLQAETEIEKELVAIWSRILNKEKIGILDDFFVLGGHSLKAIRLINEYRKAFNVRINLQDIFESTSLSSHSVLIGNAVTESFVEIENAPIQENYPISVTQRRLWILDQLEVGAAYNMPFRTQLDHIIDVDIFIKSIDATIERHEILRTIFKEDSNGEVRQWVLTTEELGFKVDYKDLREVENSSEEVTLLLAEDDKTLFDLERGPLLRACLIQLADNQFVFGYNMHHIISDGWSLDILMKDVLAFYNAFIVNELPELSELRIQYKDYAVWQLSRLKEESFEIHKNYWLNHLQGELPRLNLPTNRLRPVIQTFNGRRLSTYISKETTDQLRIFSNDNKGSVFIGLLSAWVALFHRYTGEESILLGSPIAGRNHLELENQIGFYVGTLILKNEISSQSSFNSLFSSVKETTLASLSHSEYPFDKLVEELNVTRDPGRNAVFDIMFTLQNIGERVQSVQLSQTDIDSIKDEGIVLSKMDLEITCAEVGNFLSFSLEYNTSVYDRETIERLMNHFKEYLAQLLKSPEKSIASVSFLNNDEERQLLKEFNNTEFNEFDGNTIVGKFEEQVRNTPDAIAIESEDEMLTYRELDARANQLAHYLVREFDVSSGDLITIKLPREVWSVVSIFAVLKSGGAYVPVDPAYPKERIEFIESDSKSKVSITDDFILNFKKVQESFSSDPIHLNGRDNALSYVIYTSGSTGRPKGVPIRNNSLMNYVNWSLRTYKHNENDVIGKYLNIAFDASVEEIYPTLLSGAKLQFIPNKFLIDIEGLNQYVQSKKISILILPASISEHFLALENSSLRILISGGDKMKGFRPKSYAVYNHYGPTETTVTCLTSLVTNADLIPIGRPVSNVSAYILNQENLLCPVGVKGELCIGGFGLSEGYLNLPELTLDRFVINPFKEDEKLYKTGDEARWLANGEIEFVGRIDDQVKIDGYRIELGEIESVLSKNEEIEGGVVSVTKENSIVAYYTSHTEIAQAKLRSYMKEHLPTYMIPTYFVQLQALPLTSNGKIDKRALPTLSNLGIESDVEFVAAQNNVEQRIVIIWSSILERKKIGANQGFFELGGNSMRLLKLRSAINQEFGKNISITDLFQSTTVQLQATLISGALPEEKEYDDIELSTLTPTLNADIAVIGMSIKTPGSKFLDAFWENLKNGIESIKQFSDEELREHGISEELLTNENYIKSGSFLEDKEFFDSKFFKYLPDEARMMDPQTRVFHEVVWSALENSGYDPIQYPGLIGLYSGASLNLNWVASSMMSNSEKVNSFAAGQLNNRDFINSLIAFKLNLKGGVHFVDTACSTSLVAIHLAAKSILSGENHIAIAGGISLTEKRKAGYLYQEGMIFSKDGHNKAFDKDSSGTVAGEGAGAVVLKRLDKAIQDGDNIYAVIKGSAINNDGNRKIGYTAPSIEGQSNVIRKAQKNAGVDPNSIGYVETHGTATNLGDPIEVKALTKVFGPSEDKYCAIGTVKSNIGHLDSAAGVVGFIKTVLCLKNKTLVPSLHYKSPNPEINFEEGPFFVNTEVQKWESEGPLRAGVSSFGIGGTNAHIILEEAPELKENLPVSTPQLVQLSAKSAEALDRQQTNLADYLSANMDVNFADLSWTLGSKRRTFNYRKAFVAQNAEDAVQILSGSRKAIHSGAVSKQKKKIIFMFPGQGSQYINMGKDLYEENGVFTQTMDHCFELANELVGTDFKEIIYPSNDETISTINQTSYTQPILFMFEYALAKQLEYIGIQPDFMIGHSIGEYVAACVSGVLDLKESMGIVIKRGQLMDSLPKGSMLSVGVSSEKIAPFLTMNISIAAINTKMSAVVSGVDEEISKLIEVLEKEEIPFQKLKTSHAFHSEMMSPILEEFKETTSKIRFKAPNVPYISNITSQEIALDDLADENYWSNHIRQTVNFSQGIQHLIKLENAVFIEVGPGKSLCDFVRQDQLKTSNHDIVNLIRHVKDEVSCDNGLLSQLGKLWTIGVPVDFSKLNHGESRRVLPLPTYPFEKIPYPIGENLYKIITDQLSFQNVGKRSDISDWFYEPSWKKLSVINARNSDWENENCLLFTDQLGVGLNLKKTICHEATTVVEVRQGTEFQKVSSTEYILNPEQDSDYLLLFTELKKSNCLPNRIIHLWNLNSEKLVKKEFIKEELSHGFYSVLAIAKSIGIVCPALKLQFVGIANNSVRINSEELLQPGKVTLVAALEVVRKEYKNIVTKFIDVKLNNKSPEAEMIQGLLGEIYTATSVGKIALRGKNRWLETVEPIRIEANDHQQKIFVKDKVYLITGALGGMGLVLGEYLSNTVGAKLILLGRKKRSNEIDAQLKGFKNDLIYVDAQVTNKDQLELRLTQAEKEIGGISGVIHTAGIADFGGIIQNRERTNSEDIFEAKVFGTMALFEVVRNKKLDFFINCSSLASIYRPSGQVGYTAANMFQESFMEYADSQMDGDAISIGWDTWKDVGMAAKVSQQLGGTSAGEVLTQGISNNEGIEVFTRSLDRKISNLLVSTVHLEASIKSHENQIKDKEIQELPQRLEAIQYRDLTTDSEKRLGELFVSFFGIESIRRDDDFFDLGGDSLKAMTLINHIHKVFNVEITLNDFMSYPSVGALAKRIDDFESSNDESEFHQIEAIPEAQFYSVSSSQQRLLILSQFQGASETYNLPVDFELNGDYDINNLRKAVNATIERHEILRTVFIKDANNQFKQRILSLTELNFEMSYVDFRTNYNKEEKYREYIEKDRYKIFDLENGPLLRASLLHIEEDRYILYYNMHHVISDIWSMEVLKKDVFEHYYAIANQTEPNLVDLRIQYKDYAAWQLDQLKDGSFSEHREYWLNNLSGELPILNLPSSKRRPAIRTHQGHSLSAFVSNETTSKLKALIKEQGGSLFIGLLANWNAFIHRYSGNEDIIFGSPVAGRNHIDLENQIGFYVETLALRNSVNPNQNFKELYESVKENTLSSFQYQSFPLDQIVEGLDLKVDRSRGAIFDLMFTLQNINSSVSEIAPVNVESIIDLGFSVSKFDLEITCAEVGDYIGYTVNFNTDVYEYEMIEKFVTHYREFLNQLVATPDESIGALTFITKEEKQQLLVDFNDTKTDYPKNKTIAELFEEQVEKTPKCIALVFENTELSYEELNTESNLLASYLKKTYDIKPDDLIAINLDRTEQVIISILAVLKSGGAYVPIDSDYPKNRIDFMLEDCACKVVIDKNELNAFQKVKDRYDSSNLKVETTSQDLAYVMYTSGSTGQPKGVLIEQRSVVRLIKNSNFFNFTTNDILLSTGSFAFDATTLEYWGPLLNGSKLIYSSKEVLLNPVQLSEIKTAHKVNVMWFTIGLLNQLIDSNIEVFDGLGTIFFGGDKLSMKHILKLQAYSPDLCIIHAYGPTENTTFSTTYDIPKNVKGNIPIGGPISNGSCYILNKSLELQPVGVEGEIYLGGDGVARGYLNLEELTSEKFIDNPFVNGDRLYKSGDLGYWNSNGTIEFSGRVDDQVKIRGFRIELGEIEHALRSISEIENAVVLVSSMEDGNKEVTAYFTSTQALNLQDLRTELGTKLPAYMLPSFFIELEELPLNSNGKIDKNALPSPEGLGLKSGIEFVAPRTDIEKRIVAIWEQVLAYEGIGIYDDFFALGGHSLKATRLVSEYAKEFEVKVSIQDIFSHSVVLKHAELIAHSTKVRYDEIKPLSIAENYPVSDSQKRLWIVSQSPEGSRAYNMQFQIELNDQLNIENFNDAITKTVQRHEILRTVFKLDYEGEVKQWIVELDEASLAVRYFDLRNENNKEKAVQEHLQSNANSLFDLENGPLFRSLLLQVDENKYLFHYVLHHIISDGSSMEVLTRDVLEYYRAMASKLTLEKTPLKIHYKDYVAWMDGQVTGENGKAYQSYWSNVFKSGIPEVRFPFEKKRPTFFSHKGNSIEFNLGSKYKRGIEEIAEKNDTTVYTVVLAILKFLIVKYTGKTRVMVGSSFSTRVHSDLEDQIGFYVNNLPIVSSLDENLNLEEMFQNVKASVLKTLEFRLYPMELLLEEVDFTYNASMPGLFNILLEYHPKSNNGIYESDQNETECCSYLVHHTDVPNQFDLALEFFERGSDVDVQINYNKDLFEERHIDLFRERLLQITEQVICNVNSMEMLKMNDIEFEKLDKKKADTQLKVTIEEKF